MMSCCDNQSLFGELLGLEVAIGARRCRRDGDGDSLGASHLDWCLEGNHDDFSVKTEVDFLHKHLLIEFGSSQVGEVDFEGAR